MGEDFSSHDWKFNGLFFVRLWRIWWRYLFPSFSAPATVLLFVLLTIAVLEQFVAYQVGMLPGGFYKVLGDKNQSAFKSLFILAACIIVGMAAILSTKQFVTGLLYLNWRETLTKALHRFYFRKTNYYKINVLCSSIDNPDQRMTQDVDRLCQNLSSIVPTLVIWPFTTGYYLYKAYEGSGYVGPVSALCFFLIACVCNKFILTPTVRFYARQERCEGDFRFKHMQLRSHAESMAFFDSGRLECRKTDEKLAALLRVQNGLVLREFGLKFAVNLCDYTGSILSYLNIAVPIFLGAYDDLRASDLASLISRNAFVSIYLISRFTSIIDLANQVPDIAGTAHRIGELLEYLTDDEDLEETRVDKKSPPPDDVESQLSLRTQEQTLAGKELSSLHGSDDSNYVITMPYKVVNMSYCLPSGQTLLENLNLKITSGSNILITGDSGCGKTSLLRVLHKLWPIKSGSVECSLRPGTKGVMFLPQKPFFTNGTLRAQICYPKPPVYSLTVDLHIQELLKLADLWNVYDRFGGMDVCDLNWFDVLSPGEQQRFSFVRLFYHRPAFAVLDEATSQLGIDMEGVMYSKCKELGITVISVGHRTTLFQYHEQRLHLSGKGTWTLESLRDDSSEL